MVSGSCHRNREGFAAITDLQSPQSPIYGVRVDFKSTFRPTFRVAPRSDEAVRAPSTGPGAGAGPRSGTEVREPMIDIRPGTSHSRTGPIGGGDGIRTHCLYIANVALYQLSYTPEEVPTLAQGAAGLRFALPTNVAVIFVEIRRKLLFGLHEILVVEGLNRRQWTSRRKAKRQ
jgi:hypothetical protein